MRQFFLFLFSLSFLSNFIYAKEGQASYPVLVDRYLSARTGSDTLIFINKLAQTGEDLWTNNNPEYYSVDLAMGSLRAFELASIWNPLNYLFMLYQHEFFGHGSSIRLIHDKKVIDVLGYSYSAPPPYGNGAGATKFVVHKNLSDQQHAMISAAGVNATALLATNLRKNWLEQGTLDGRSASLYLFSYHDLSDYVYGWDYAKKHATGNDMNDYSFYLERAYNHPISPDDLKSKTLANYADPFTYYAIYAWFQYIYNGRPIEIPTIPLGDWKYLPSFRLFLAPYGPEYSFYNYFISPSGQVAEVTIRSGEFAGQKSLGLHLSYDKIYTLDLVSFDASVDLWQQPSIATHNHKVSLIKNKTSGAAFTVLGRTEMDEGTYFVAEVGYKTRGFLVGYPLQKNLIARVGFSFDL